MSYNYKPLYEDTDSIYGTGIVKYKENKNMNREYIVVHYDNHKTGIIFKDKIVGVFNETEGDVEETRIMTACNNTFVMDKYADIVKQLI